MDEYISFAIDRLIPASTIPFMAFMGAFVLYATSKLRGKQPFSLLHALNVDVFTSDAKWGTILLDMIISSGAGTMIVLPITSPTNVPQAVLVGLGMSGILTASIKEGAEK